MTGWPLRGVRRLPGSISSTSTEVADSTSDLKRPLSAAIGGKVS